MEARPALARLGAHSRVGWQRKGWGHSNRQASMRGQRSCWPPRTPGERGGCARILVTLRVRRAACGVASGATQNADDEVRLRLFALAVRVRGDAHVICRCAQSSYRADEGDVRRARVCRLPRSLGSTIECRGREGRALHRCELPTHMDRDAQRSQPLG